MNPFGQSEQDLTATPDQAQEMHKYIRDLVKGKIQ